MDFCRSQNRKQPSKHNKKMLNPEQVRLLESSFTSNKMLEPERKLQLAEQLGVSPRQVAIWYQNKRARWKTQSLELEYSLLHQELENALLEKRGLEKDVERLKGELAKTQELVLALKQTGSSSQVSCTSISLDKATGSSSLHDQGTNCTAEKDEVFPLLDQDFYVCLIGEDGSSWD